jgi:hypothetical protein
MYNHIGFIFNFKAIFIIKFEIYMLSRLLLREPTPSGGECSWGGMGTEKSYSLVRPCRRAPLWRDVGDCKSCSSASPCQGPCLSHGKQGPILVL